MKAKHITLLIIIICALLFAGCDMTETPIATPTYTPAPQNTTDPLVGNTPNVTATPTATILEMTTAPETTPSPTVAATTQNVTPTPTADPDLLQRTQEMNEYLPALDTNLRFFGIAETGHYGQLTLGHTAENEAMYQFNGTYDDGIGVPDEFTVQYFINYERGTITEKAGYNERLDKKEFHSKLHNIVVLKFPLSLGATWGHSTYIDGSKYWVTAEVIEYDGNKAKILYTAEGVTGYYDDTYFEMRTYEKSYGMTSFGNIMQGDLDMTGVDTNDEDAVREHIMNMHMFGYSLDK